MGAFDKQKISNLDIYNIFMQSINGEHGLAANNRKFYWNPIENFFEPINYDTNSNIENTIQEGEIRYPVSENFYSSFERLRTNLKDLDYSEILKI